MDCQKFQDNMAGLTEAAFEAEYNRQLASHRDQCADCARAYSELEQTMAAMKNNKALEPSTDFENKVLSRIRRQNADTSRDRKVIKVPLFRHLSRIAAIILIVITAGILASVLLRSLGDQTATAAELRAKVGKLAEVSDIFLLQAQNVESNSKSELDALQSEFAISGLEEHIRNVRTVLENADQKEFKTEAAFVISLDVAVEGILRNIDQVRVMHKIPAEFQVVNRERVVKLRKTCADLTAHLQTTAGNAGNFVADSLPELPVDYTPDTRAFLTARVDYYQGDYRDAQTKFELVLQEYPDSVFTDDALVYAAKSAALTGATVSVPEGSVEPVSHKIDKWFTDDQSPQVLNIISTSIARTQKKKPDFVEIKIDDKKLIQPNPEIELALWRNGKKVTLVWDNAMEIILDKVQQEYPDCVEVMRRGHFVYGVILPKELKENTSLLAELTPFFRRYPKVFVYK
ncbi:hypothetical protein ACFL54_07120 [Planctomycetota bacterium]